MKNRVKAILLAAGLTVSCFGVGTVYAEETTEVTEQQATDDAAVTSGGTYADYYETLKSYVTSDLETLSAMTDAQLESAIADPTVSSALVAIYANWQSVKEELGSFVEVSNQTVSEDGYVITVVSDVVYDGVSDKTNVTVTTTFDMATQEQAFTWDIEYPMSYLIQQAGLNTIMGVAIVFLVLLFLSFLIKQMHWIPDLMDRRKKEQEPPKPATVAPLAPAAEQEEELVNDGELVAVIAAAIAASANTTTDGFVVRSIKKASKKNNWQRA